jgi:8-oxo-dGTP pyrophosphatase MutT (NUDIX family)
VRLTAVNATPPVLAAGAVVWRPGHGGIDVLLVHRPKYDDWSFPKGKLDPGEHVTEAAVREVAEETGLEVRLGVPLPRQEYAAAPGLTKQVHYWAARPARDNSAVDDYAANHEIDAVVWCRLDQARDRLTYSRDLDVLDAFAVGDYGAEPLVVLRHAQALPRDSWVGPDHERGLATEGKRQADRVVPLLRAYGVRRVLSSDAVRCTATLRPYADDAGLRVEVDHWMSEEGQHRTAIARRIRALLDDNLPTVICTHRPVLPALFDSLGVHDPSLRPGAFLVVHRDRGRVCSTEHHGP